MKTILMTAAALTLLAGAAAASLATYPVNVDPATLTDRQQLLIENAIHSGGSTSEIIGQINRIVSRG